MKKLLGRHVSEKQPFRWNISPIPVFVSVGIIALCVLLCCFLFSHGTLISQYFYDDLRDTGMDFFHSIEYVRGKAPYELFDTLYPPLANLMFYAFYHMIPPDISNHWTNDFFESIIMRGTQFDLRTYQAPLLLFLLFVLLTGWMLVSLCTSCLKRDSNYHVNTVAFCMLFSPGILYALERGNILLLVIPLTLFFVMYRNSENKLLQELALIALALAAGMKLYPAFFGVLLIRDKKYAQAIRAIAYGVLSVILPVLFFNEGLAGIPMWLSVVFNFGGSAHSPWGGVSFADILHRLASYANRSWGIAVDSSLFAPVSAVGCGILLIASLGYKKEWQSILSITVAVIAFQSQASYIFGFMCIPLLLFLAQEKKLESGNILPFLLMLLLTVHLPLFNKRTDITIKQLILLLLTCWCVITAAAACIQKKKTIRSNKHNGNMEN